MSNNNGPNGFSTDEEFAPTPEQSMIVPPPISNIADYINMSPDPNVRYVDDILKELFTHHKMERLGGASGRGWSSHASFQRCPYMFKLKYLEGQRGAPSAALEIGSLIHTFLALHYTWMLDENLTLTPEIARATLMAEGARPQSVIEAWRLYEAYRVKYENDYLTPLDMEAWAQDPDGNTCRYDLIAEVKQAHPGVMPGTYIIEHKCLHADEKLFDYSTGELVTIAELAARGQGPVVLAYDPHTRRMIKTRAHVPQPTATRDVHEVVLESGQRLRTSDNHPFLTARGWVTAAALTREDWVALAPSTGGYDGPDRYTDAQVELVGLMLGDGCMPSGDFTSANAAIMERFRTAAKAAGGEPRTFACDEGRTPRARISNAQDNPAQFLLEELGLSECLAATKFIPDQLLRSSDRQIDLLLGALWNTDGCVDVFHEQRVLRLDEVQPWDSPDTKRNVGVLTSQNKVRIAYVSRSRALCEGVQTLLQRRGIPSSMTESSIEYNDERRDVWTTKVVTREGKRRFLDAVVARRIPFVKYEVTNALNCIKPGDDAYIPSAYVKLHVPVEDQPGMLRQQLKNRAVERETLKKYYEKRPSEALKRVIDTDLAWDRVSSVVVSGRAMMYDITVPHVHNFVANGIITHNSHARFTADVLEGYRNDGEILGQIMIWKRAKLDKKYGKLRGTIVNIVGKQKIIQFHRTIIPAQRWHVTQHMEDLKMWSALQQMYAATDVWPKARANCVGRWGMCEFFDHCAENRKPVPIRKREWAPQTVPTIAPATESPKGLAIEPPMAQTSRASSETSESAAIAESEGSPA